MWDKSVLLIGPFAEHGGQFSPLLMQAMYVFFPDVLPTLSVWEILFLAN